MAYMSQEKKAKLAPAIKAILAKYGVKGTLAVNNHSTLILNIRSGRIDFVESFNRVNTARPRESWNQFRPSTGDISVNTYHYRDHFDGRALEFLEEVVPAMNVGNHDRSDIQTDYFDVGWYVNLNIGNWRQPYTVE